MSGYIGNIPVPQATQTRQSFTATASQTTFNTAGYSVGYVDVFLNGVKLAPADYTATNGSDIILAVGAASGDILETVAYEIFQVVDQDFTGDFTVDGTTFVVDSTNNRVGIGTTSPDKLLHVYEGNSGITPNTSAYLTLESDGANFINILKPNGTIGGLLFSGNSVNADGRLTYDDGASRAMQFYTASAERMRIDSSGNLLVGKTSTSTGTVGGEIRSDGLVVGVRSSANAGVFGRNTTDGEILGFRKDGGAVGSIGTFQTGEMYVGSGDTGFHFNASSNNILPANTSTTSLTDNTIGIGSSSYRFTDLYLSGGVYLGGTGAANKLDDYEEGTWTPVFERETTNPSYSSQTTAGRYIKIGNTVYVAFYFFCLGGNFSSTGSGTPLISGLPFYLAYGQTGEYSGGTGVYNVVGGTQSQPSNGKGFIWRNEGNKFRLYADNTTVTASGYYEFSMSGVFSMI